MTTNMSEPSDPLDGLLGGLKPRRSPPAQAQARAYDAVKRIHWDGAFCRSDIGWRALNR